LSANEDSGDDLLVHAGAATYPDGFRLERHQHPEWAQLTFCIRGVMRVTSDEVAWLSPPTRAVCLPAGAPHEIVMQGEEAARFLYVQPKLAAPLAAPRVIEVAPLLRELILHILKIRLLGPATPEHVRLAGLLVDLLFEARPIDLALPLPRDRRARALAERLQAAPAEALSLGELARGAGASLRTLQRLFPHETGLTLDAWRQKARLIAGVAALSAGAPVAVTAANCGYESPSAFITAFKRQFGVTPGRYRAA
jgi:AraC-like DNA-binding protein